jgi:hypothetical protein
MKYIALIMIFALCVSFTWAEETTPQENPQAKELKDNVKTFADKYLKEKENKYLTDLIGDVDKILADLTPDDTRDQFDPKGYMDGVAQKVDKMMSRIEEYEKQGSCKNDYLKEVSDSFVQEYAKDLNADVKDITTNDYLKDLDSVYSSYDNKLEDMNKPASSNTGSEYNPAEHLDKSALGKVAKPVKIDFSWAGVNDHWLGYKLVDLIKQFKGKGFDKKAKKDFQWISKIWSQGIETGGMEAASYDGSVYNDKNKQSGANKKSYRLNAYGKLMTSADDIKAIDEKVKPTESFTKADGTYNNRQYGYKYNNGTYTTIKITTGGREYNLQETVYTSPLILDMDGDARLEASNGKWLPHGGAEGTMVEFDMDGDGFVDLTEWVGPNDGILLVYKGEEVDANNMFGTEGGFFHGYEKLSLLDKDGDSQITGDELKTLSVWMDKNGNAKVDASEVSSVASLGITSISLTFNDQLVSSFTQNGVSKKVWDWYPTMLRVQRKQ